MARKKSKQHYDFVFSLGQACSCSSSLRAAKLQYASYPFDWLYGSDITDGRTFWQTAFKGGWTETIWFIRGTGIIPSRATFINTPKRASSSTTIFLFRKLWMKAERASMQSTTGGLTGCFGKSENRKRCLPFIWNLRKQGASPLMKC